jgi:enolase
LTPYSRNDTPSKLMPKIKTVKAREILDSRGNPTVEVDLFLDNDVWGRAAVPSGASTGSFEAVELRDGGDRYVGKGVRKAVENVMNTIAPRITGVADSVQETLDEGLLELDGTATKENLGANALLAVSLAYAKASATAQQIPLYRYIAGLVGKKGNLLPTPMMNIVNGGAHANNGLDIQEFMIMPVGSKSFSEALRAGAEIFQSLKKVLADQGHSTAVGDEGGFAPQIESTEQALQMIERAVGAAGYRFGDDICLALDAASTEFYDGTQYTFHGDKGLFSDAAALTSYYGELRDKYPIISIEDGLAEDDWAAWHNLTSTLGEHIQLIGDDLYVTNVLRLKKGIEEKAGNAILIKVNQIGTLTETLRAIACAQEAGFGVIISHRSGETEDTSIADISVGTEAGQIKTGSLSRTDRTAKYNQLLRIEEELGEDAIYAGHRPFDKFHSHS